MVAEGVRVVAPKWAGLVASPSSLSGLFVLSFINLRDYKRADAVAVP